MSFIPTVVVSLTPAKNPNTPKRKATIVRPCSDVNAWYVAWHFVQADGNVYKTAPTKIYQSDWNPHVVVMVQSGGVATSTYLNSHQNYAAWGGVRRVYNRIAGRNRSSNWKPAPSPYEATFTKREDGFTRYKSSGYFHEPVKEILEKHFHYQRAVVITPDSWFDKKLQETYNSSSGKDKEKD